MISLKFNRNRLRKYCAKNKVKYLALTGLHAQGLAQPYHHAKFKVDFYHLGYSQDELLNLQIDLELMLNKRVDLTLVPTKSPYSQPQLNPQDLLLYRH